MSDIGRRIQRYRLSRYAIPGGGFGRLPRWLWLIVGAWLVYLTVFSEHSLYRIWRMSDESHRAGRDLEATRREIDRLDRQAHDPKARLRETEQALRKDGFARPGEIIYRLEKSKPDSLAR
ncbi:MAG: septum formation initiator family protein [Candidatus Eisenbacteria bacterium]|uniref:Septum formation initiator family protein n=1 Tax=Eiseniibacteriota bacterium TaxID=2212470 RepID=A0A9D6LCC3_UNCEI|nr:septum formation initiator family protein [Candidatus Eisenbacteria bacterium]MBI3540104.1 septum formation initiator family protein [Candidatus Eisenbacteria bacterium]